MENDFDLLLIFSYLLFKRSTQYHSAVCIKQGQRNVYGHTDWSAQSFGKIIVETQAKMIDSIMDILISPHQVLKSAQS